MKPLVKCYISHHRESKIDKCISSSVLMPVSVLSAACVKLNVDFI
uniref:Macaca fascicularis brain cDNA clone: QorA-13973, similar to human hypothetical protein DKFZp564D172 (DKFZP564D172), mRNA, RefSeq: NM_032042.3 n=1 Tax=Macaca fascicularis TaxID=9541 RepID=I7GA26_MACFA|nr:unnamed protein product [Macaca fascicularis]